MSIALMQRRKIETTTNAVARWICCQLGAREHYAIPRALNRIGILDRLLTDVWVAPRSLRALFPLRRWKDRFTSELEPVVAWNAQAAFFEIGRRRPGQNGWALVMSRNQWFQNRVLKFLQHWHGEPGILFSYSYTADRVFDSAKQRGWRLVLGQIDPGPVEERIVSGLFAESGQPPGSWQTAPQAYWDGWRRECGLADHIVVNSAWSRQALLEEGTGQHKIEVVPLVYEPPPHADRFERRFSAAFSRSRPLRVLFLGQANLRKGMGVLLPVMERMVRAPVEFQIVGPVQIAVPAALRSQDNIRWEGAVPRSRTEDYYRNADVFLFPTFSDGFGLTQLEAQAWKLPVITSQFCGDVVQDGVNGILLPEVTPEAVETAVTRCLRNPAELAAMSQRSRIESRFSIDALTRSLSRLGAELACSIR